jgi:mannan endo-1,4-beta-mannosidase
LVDYWVRPDIVAVIQKHQEYVLVNIGNEVGQTVSDADYISGYTTAVNRMRTAGIHVPLVIDAASYGQNIDGLQANGPTLIQNDPEHNLLFSVHMWWPYAWGYTDQRVIDEIAQTVNMNLPLVIGEFGNQWDETATGQIPYKIIIREAHLNEIGYLPWSWGPGNNPQTFLDMTTDQTYATLHGWGLEVAVTDTHSIKNIAVRPAWLNSVPPTPVPTAVPSNLVSFNKPVTVSSVTGANTGPRAVDGNGGTRWESQISDPQWIQIDLGSAFAITNVDIVWEGAYATQYKLQISNDATTWTDAYTEWSGTGGTKVIPVNQTARYVRMNGTQRVNSAWGYSIWEFRVWSGTAGPTFTPTRTFTPMVPTITLTPTRTATSLGPTNTPTRTNTPNSFTPTRTNTPNSFTPTRTNTPPAITNTPTRTFTPQAPTITPTTGAGACSPVTSTITIPFSFDGAGTFCWQASSLGSFINSWNTTSVTLNGVNVTNIWMGSGSYPAKINNNYYVSYNSGVAWGHFEAK